MPSTRIEFTGSLGHPLAGRLDTPDTVPRAWALFAHCFTCSKDSRAAAYIARALAEAGQIPVIASGGVGNIDHIRQLKALPIWGVIVGRSLYEGTLDLRQAIQLAS